MKVKHDFPVRLIDDGDAFPERVVEVAGVYVVLSAQFGKGARLCRNGDYLGYVQRLADFCETLAQRVIGNVEAEPGDRADADSMIRVVADLRESLEGGDIGGACLDAIGIGKLAERLRFRICGFNKNVIHARKVEKALGKGRDKKARATADRRKEIAAAVKARMDDNRKDSPTSARRYVASQLGISFNTVRNATAGMKRPRKKMKK
ncbi:MAG: hypothetical protein KKE86_13670 [Planctomycetes bacterium]|nr:hypothetical protein [Planctomycetota bacterium]MBU4400369.1 hypothetical protein [Planctomycetota bacterium]MCG2685362.1 hypothetical protein [Planctomycetales bacterium]